MKEAVVFILDASPSMLTPYPSTPTSSLSSSTRLDCAKEVVESMVCDLMLQSKTNEVAVIVCKTLATRHHKIAAGVDLEEHLDDGDEENIPFPNLTELTSGVVRPSVELLRQIWQVQPCSAAEAHHIRGDIVDAVVLAADALHEKTRGRKYARKIVALTDAGHDIVVDMKQLLVVVDALRSMECRLEVIGLDFSISSAAVFDEALPAPQHNEKRIKQEEIDLPADDTDSRSSQELLNRLVYSEKIDREVLLQSLTEKTGGRVVVASSMQQLLDLNKGKRIKTATRRKFEFQIAPGFSFEARYMLLMKKESCETLKVEAVMVDDETGELMTNSMGQEMTDPVATNTFNIDEECPDDAVPAEKRTTAIRYGTELIPMSNFDLQGIRLETRSCPRMDILGYIERKQIPPLYMIGPPYMISGASSRRACAAISALAKALHRLERAAVCTFSKTKQATESLLGTLLPLPDDNCCEPIHLVFLQIPYKGEVQQLNLPPLEEYLCDADETAVKQAKACDGLIDALMLPSDVMQSGQVPSPFLRSWNMTKVKRAIDPKAGLVFARRGINDPMTTPTEILGRAHSAVERVTSAFPLTVKDDGKERANKTKKRKKKVATYLDYVS